MYSQQIKRKKVGESRMKKKIKIISYLLLWLLLFPQLTFAKNKTKATESSTVESSAVQLPKDDSKTTEASQEKEEIRNQTNKTSTVFPQKSPRTIESDLIDQLTAGWTVLPEGATDGFLENIITSSRIGFKGRGLEPKGSTAGARQGFYVTDSQNVGYIHHIRSTESTPYVNGNKLFPAKDLFDGSIERHKFSKSYFLKKGNLLREVLVDSLTNTVFVYDISLAVNLNFKVELSMYNTAAIGKSFSMLEFGDTDYYTDYVPVYSLPNGSGLSLQVDNGTSNGVKKLSVVIKDRRGNFFSDYDRYTIGLYNTYYPTNQFGSDFAKQGMEIKTNAEPERIMDGSKDSSYQIGASPKMIGPGDKLEMGYEMFLGDPIPYMEVASIPHILSVYEDYAEDTLVNYNISKIPDSQSGGTEGEVTYTFPDGSITTENFNSQNTGTFASEFTIRRNTLPTVLNDDTSKVEKYYTEIFGIVTDPLSVTGLVTDGYDVEIDAYKFGAKPIPQIIQKNGVLKPAEELLTDKGVIPENNILYEFEGDLPDLSTVGMKFVKVKMTDTTVQPNKSIIITVPISVIDGTIPTNGIHLNANNIKEKAKLLENKTMEEIKQFILDKSAATAWDIATGSTDGIDITVSTNIPLDPVAGSYTAKIVATKGTEVTEKNITIELLPDVQNVRIQFLDEEGGKLHEDVLVLGKVESTIDLTKETKVKTIVDKLISERYIKTKSPDKETAVEIGETEKTVVYQFKGTLFIDSYPKTIDFGTKFAENAHGLYQKPDYKEDLIIKDNRATKSKWTLTAKLQDELTNVDRPSITLLNAVRYKQSPVTSVPLVRGQAIEVETGSGNVAGIYNVSEKWDNNDAGFQLKINDSQYVSSGRYTTSVLWEIGATP